MAKKASSAMPLTAKSTAKERWDANRQHHGELIGHTLDAAQYGGHGHASGSGPTGKMVQSDAHMQGGASKTSRGKPYIAQGVLPPMGRDGGGRFDDNQQAADDYGKAGTDE
ncbi:MAG: hypothetical protein WAM04_09920 [Candidatus Sulfotelmatobacter sp.]